MRICKTHWIQYRDKYEANQKLLAANIMTLEVVLENDKCTKGINTPFQQQDVIHKESDGCPACFYKARNGKEIFDNLDLKLQ